MEALRNLSCRLDLRVETRKFLSLLCTLFSFVLFYSFFFFFLLDSLSSIWFARECFV